MLKIILNSVLIFLLYSIYSSAQNQEEAATQSGLDYQIQLPQAFPPGRYTPYGYLDNPYHSMVYNRSGVIRSFPPLGFGFWKRAFRGSYAEGPRAHLNYLSLLQMSIHMDGTSFFTMEDFNKNGVEIFSQYHTKNVMSYDWTYRGIEFSFKYYLAGEDALLCLVSITNLTKSNKEVTLHCTSIYGDWELKWWGSNGVSHDFVEDENVSVMKIWAYGDVFLMGSDWKVKSAKASGDQESWENWIRQNDLNNQNQFTIKGKGPLYTVHSYQNIIPPETQYQGLFYLCRGKNEAWTMKTFRKIQKERLIILLNKLTADEVFWNKCPKLAGDWPAEWCRGWVYDWETLRMNVRPPIGIFKHPWDGMQVHSPRLVLGETALDMFTMSYADPELAKEVLYGTFADAIAPNIPCVREDGSVNMIGADGSECGTAPMWGFPYHAIQSIFLATRDSTWIGNLYPYLKDYIIWWLENRTDNEGWFHCNNSWESGQDGSRRFLVEGEGDPATFVRTVDVEASMAEAMKNMANFSSIANVPADISFWDDQAARRFRNTRSMYLDGWFRDIDGRNGKSIIFEDFYDPIMLAPLTCNVATTEQMKEIKPKIAYIGKNPRWLQWPPGVMAFTEAAWNADEQEAASAAVRNIADRIYARTDARNVMFSEKEDPFSYRIPGVANEFWPLQNRPPGAENYGWGAILPLFIIRNIVGFREKDENSFYLAPLLPEDYLQGGKTYGLSNLKYQDLHFNLLYEIQKNNIINISISTCNSDSLQLQVLNSKGDVIKEPTSVRQDEIIEFKAVNGNRYIIQLITQ